MRRWRGWKSWMRGAQTPSESLGLVRMTNWVARVVGAPIRLRKLRWNSDVPAWQVDGVVAQSGGERLDVHVPKGTMYEMPGRELWVSDHGEDLSFRRGAWWHVMHAEAPGVHWYCNVTTPVEYRGGALTWTDLGIDVEVYPGGDVALDDLPEFLEVRGALPAKEFDEAVRATRGLMDDGAAGRAPFRARGGRPAWIEQKLFWLAPGLGDGLAAVGRSGRRIAAAGGGGAGAGDGKSGRADGVGRGGADGADGDGGAAGWGDGAGGGVGVGDGVGVGAVFVAGVGAGIACAVGAGAG